MLNIVQYILYIIFCVYILVKNISYALYEKNTNENKTGSIYILSLTILAIVASNYVALMVLKIVPPIF